MVDVGQDRPDASRGSKRAVTGNRRLPSVDAVVATAFALWGAYIGSRPFDDNSFMTHLATGRLILDGTFPRTDPYSFTAPGEPWVVQSWLASVSYASAERLLGSAGVHIVIVGLTATLGVLVWTLTRRAESLIPRLGVAALVMAIGAFTWSERPLLVGLVGIGLTLLVAEQRLDPRWLVPTMWVWANSHGSFPMGLGLLVVVAIGARLDGERRPRELRALAWALLGTALAVVGPLGFEVLTFPVQLLSRSDVLQNIVEWQSPSFQSTWSRLFLLEIALAIVALVRRPSWRYTLVMVVFTAAALIAARNVAVASIVLVPGTAYGFRGLGSITGDRRSPVTAAAVAVLASGVVVVGLSAVQGTGWALRLYPVAAVSWIEEQGLRAEEINLATQDFVGNYQDAVFGPSARVFIDDRYDMWPEDLSNDYREILALQPGWREVLDRWEVDLVLWGRDQPLTQALLEADEWRVVWQDRLWVVACRRGSEACAVTAEGPGG